MGSVRTLDWLQDAASETLAPHRLRAVEIPGGIRLILFLEKAGGPQTLKLDLAGVSIPDFLAQWMQYFWQEIPESRFEDMDSGQFFVIRYIRITQGIIVWRVDHRKQVPYDLLDFLPGATLSDVSEAYRRI